ncbi:MAG TPA: DnaT-like ssDNA-binding protein [Gammaproteobacteria bacterium]|nr:DnaT-like ssDNA-binding protein [Gammaproteobacteria bacterium]
MPFTVQSDEGNVADANAYIDVDYFKNYHSDRGNSIIDPATSAPYTDPQIQGAIVVATDFIDAKPCIVDEPLTENQTTAFPRDTDEGIPVKVKRATAEYALAQLKGGIEKVYGFEEFNQFVTSERSKVGPIEEEKTYSRPASLMTVKKVPVAERLLADYLCNSDRFGSFTVFRG